MAEVCFNGIIKESKKFCNAHLSYKGRSIIVDYEHLLHDYDYITENCVPCRVYPYEDDVLVIDVKLDSQKVNIEDLIQQIDYYLEEEWKEH